MRVRRRAQEVTATTFDTRLVINPQSDLEFGRRARELLGRSAEPEQLQALLRPEYPRASVVRGVTDVVERWYVYREGRWINGTKP